MKRIKFMPEYHSWPLWHIDYEIDGQIGNIDPKNLPISSKLSDDINSWSEIFDSILNMDDPMDSGFNDSLAAENFINYGNDLANRLELELDGK